MAWSLNVSGAVRLVAGLWVAIGPASTSLAASPEDWLRRLEGSFVGATTCGTPAALELKVTKVEGPPPHPLPRVLRLEGELKVMPKPGSKEGEFEVGVVGSLDPARPVLLAGWFVDNSDPTCVMKVGKRCVLRETGPGGFLVQRMQRQRAEFAKKAAFHLEAMPDADGLGWSGTLRGASTDCPAVTLRRKDAPPAGPRKALSYDDADHVLRQFQRDALRYATDGTAMAYWLREPADAGDPFALHRLALLHEAGAPGVNADPKRALDFHRQAAERGDARSQDALAKALADGTLLAKDPAASQLWALKARATRDAASRICAAPQAVRAYYALIDAENAAPMNRLAGAVMAGITGISYDPGTYTIIAAQSEGVGLADRPFRCQTVARRSGASYSSETPTLEYAGDDENGTPLYRDNRAEAAVNNALAGALTQVLNATPMVSTFIVKPLGGTRYLFAGRQDIRVSATDFSQEVDIGATAAPTAPAAPPPSARPGAATGVATGAATTPRPPAAAVAPAAATAPPNSATPAPSAEGAWDMARVHAGLDVEFTAWSRNWGVDRFVPGSAKVAAQDCKLDVCTFTGQFVVARMGTPVPVPFLAMIKRQGDLLLIGRLCYEDRTTGMRDCAR
jgi:hypothetical protein